MLTRKEFDIDADTLRQLYEVEELSFQTIANRYGTYGSTVRHKAIELGIKPRTRKQGIKISHNHRGRRVVISKDDLQKTYIDGALTIEETAKELGTSIATIRARLKEYGIKTRSRSETYLAKSELKAKPKPKPKPDMPKRTYSPHIRSRVALLYMLRWGIDRIAAFLFVPACVVYDVLEREGML